MARLPKGQKPTPAPERLQLYREELIKSGGRRVIVDLPEPGATALQKITERDSSSIKDAVTSALVHFAKGGRRQRA